MPTRREFLSRSALISLTPWTPAFLSRMFAAETARRDDRILVVVQLDGGNDGLNTVIPYADENYAKYRRELRIPKKDVLKINDEVGLHPAMKPAADLLESGRLAVLQGVGYPNPDRSHFRSMAIWHTARPDIGETKGYGWLGRAWDARTAAATAAADAVFVGQESLPLALWGRRINAVTVNSVNDLAFAAPLAAGKSVSADDSVASYVERVVDQSFQAARQFAEMSHAKSETASVRYPQSDFGQKMSLLSQMIKAGFGARVYYVSQTGYDTHAGQLGPHQRLLQTFSAGVKAFFDDLAAAKLDDRVLLTAFSEFGRRVDENASAGTDHGAAGPMFLAGPAVAGKLIGQHPSLVDLDDGDLKMSLDFRGIYVSVLDHWLHLQSASVIADAPICPSVLKPHFDR